MGNEGVDSTPPEPKEAKPSWSLLQVLKGRQFEVEFLLEVVIILLIGFEIVLGIYFHLGDTQASNEQTRLLQEAHVQAQKQAQILKSIADEQEKALRSVIHMNDLLQSQLAILDAEQRRRLAEVSRKPQLQLDVGGVSLAGSVGRPVPHRELTASRAVYELKLLNKGNSSLQTAVLRVWVNSPNVTLTSDISYQEVQRFTGEPGRTIMIRINELPVGSSALFILTCEYPTGTAEFRLSFNANALNLLRVELGSITVTPTR